MSARFYWFNCIGLLLLATIIITLMQWYPRADFAIADAFYQSHNGFIYVDHWLWRDWLHENVRWFIKPAKFFFCLGLVIVILWPVRHRYRSAAIFTLFTILACNGVVSWFKGIAGRVCPNELTLYGGEYSWQPLFSSLVEKADATCWPGGHALHAFALLPIIYAFLLLNKPLAARWALLLIGAFGLLLSLTQIIRGQHFLSHQLATLFFCWATSFVAFVIAKPVSVLATKVSHFCINKIQKKRIVNG